jgi:hypothetical protein
MYIPIITGAYQPKHAESPTPFYHKLAQLASFKPGSIAAFRSKEKNIPELNSL